MRQPRGAAGASTGELAHQHRRGPIFKVFPSLSVRRLYNAALQARRAFAGMDSLHAAAPAVACERWLGNSPQIAALVLHEGAIVSQRKVIGCRLVLLRVYVAAIAIAEYLANTQLG